jgi:hypothetical protein
MLLKVLVTAFCFIICAWNDDIPILKNAAPGTPSVKRLLGGTNENANDNAVVLIGLTRYQLLVLLAAWVRRQKRHFCFPKRAHSDERHASDGMGIRFI